MTVSTIIPTYQAEGVLGRAMRSVQEQVVDAALEIIVVDDCSTDHTVEIARQAGATVHTTGQNSGGPNKGRNIGIERATGEYVCLLDQDDEWLPEKLQRQIEAARYAPIVFGGFWIKDEQTNKTDRMGEAHGRTETYAPNELFLKALSWTKKPGRNIVPSTSGIMLHRSAVASFEERFGMVDFDWLLRVLENRSAAKVGLPLYIRHVDGQNLSLDPYYRRADYCFCWFTIEGYADRYPRESREGIGNLEGTYARYFYRVGDMRKARRHLMRSKLTWKTVAYYLTSFVGSGFVKRHFRVFGT